VLAIMYGLRPFLVSSQKHKHMPSPLLGPQKVIGVITIGTGWSSLFLGCVVIHQNWVSQADASIDRDAQQCKSHERRWSECRWSQQ
jgi:hypothetical protein